MPQVDRPNDGAHGVFWKSYQIYANQQSTIIIVMFWTYKIIKIHAFRQLWGEIGCFMRHFGAAFANGGQWG